MMNYRFSMHLRQVRRLMHLDFALSLKSPFKKNRVETSKVPQGQTIVPKPRLCPDSDVMIFCGLPTEHERVLMHKLCECLTPNLITFFKPVSLFHVQLVTTGMIQHTIHQDGPIENQIIDIIIENLLKPVSASQTTNTAITRRTVGTQHVQKV
jgi:hypothetical protein